MSAPLSADLQGEGFAYLCWWRLKWPWMHAETQGMTLECVGHKFLWKGGRR